MANTNINSNDLPNELINSCASYLNDCSNTFGQLQSIFNAIIRSVDKDSDAAKLAGAGLHVANDYENAADCWREEIINSKEASHA